MIRNEGFTVVVEEGPPQVRIPQLITISASKLS